MQPMERKAVVLFSGGLDSTTVLSIARDDGFEPLALIFFYGQRHAVEVERARELAHRLKVAHRVLKIDLATFGGSALTSETIPVPRDRDAEGLADGGIPPTYVPARNTIFLSYALAWAEVLDVSDIFLGVNALDYSGYPDCRPEFIDAFERMANLACRTSTQEGRRIRVHAPLIQKTKAEIIRWGIELGVDYSQTWSCYDPTTDPSLDNAGGVASCGHCDSCLLRRKGFREAGVPDPTVYLNPPG